MMTQKQKEVENSKSKERIGKCQFCGKPYPEIGADGRDYAFCEKCQANPVKELSRVGGMMGLGSVSVIRWRPHFEAYCTRCKLSLKMSGMVSREDAEAELEPVLKRPCPRCHKERGIKSKLKLLSFDKAQEIGSFKNERQGFLLRKKKMIGANNELKISTTDFMHKDNEALVKLLITIRYTETTANSMKRSLDGISTRKLCERAFDSRSYGLRIIKRAEEAGYISRTVQKHPQGGGAKRMNSLTDKGRQLLKQLESGRGSGY